MINNKLNTAKIRTLYLILFGLILSLSAYYFFEPNIPLKKNINLAFLLLIIFVYLSMLLLKLNYFSLETSKDKVSVRFYTAHPVFRKFRLIEIPQKSFNNFYIKKTFFGLRQAIIIEAKIKKGEFKFPPVSIIALSKKDKENLKSLLNDILKPV